MMQYKTNFSVKIHVHILHCRKQWEHKMLNLWNNWSELTNLSGIWQSPDNSGPVRGPESCPHRTSLPWRLPWSDSRAPRPITSSTGTTAWGPLGPQKVEISDIMSRRIHCQTKKSFNIFQGFSYLPNEMLFFIVYFRYFYIMFICMIVELFR